MKSDDGLAIPQGQVSFDVDYFRPEDAEGIVRLFRAVYGEHYPIRLFYDPEAIIAANVEGRYYSIVARTDEGDVIGVDHLFRSAPYPSLYEAGVGLVLKEYRNTGANTRMLQFLYEEFVPGQSNIEEVFGEAVCNHPFMQKAIAKYSQVETGIEVALMPAEVYNKEGTAAGRVATLTCFRCYKPNPHRIFLPGAYEQELRWIYSRLDDRRELILSADSLPAAPATQADMTFFEFARVARIAIPVIGVDIQTRLDDLERQALTKNAVVLQVWLNLTEPWVGEAVDVLRKRGYFFGGALPRWFDGDGLLLQKLLCPPDFDGIVLVSDFAKELLEIIKRDWRRATEI